MRSFFGVLLLIAMDINSTAAEVSDAQKAEAEAAITKCESLYFTASESGKRFVMRKPLIFVSAVRQQRFDNFVISRRVYDNRITELSQIIILKEKVRSARDSDEFEEALAKYSMNCVRLASSLPLFVKWAQTGTSGDLTFDLVFWEWWNIEKCGKKACP